MRKNPFKAMLENTEPKTNDVLGAYPEKVHVRAFPERRYLKTTRIMTIFSIISLSVTIALASIVYMLAPQKTAGVSFYTQDYQETGLKFVDKNEYTTGVADLYNEKFVQDYVTMRHEITDDIDVIRDKYENKSSKLNMQSSTEIQNEIKADLQETVNHVVEEGYTRAVNIIWTKQISKKQKVYLVRFETLDFHHGKPAEIIKIWEAFIRLGYDGRSRNKMLNYDKSNLELRERHIKYAENNPFFTVVTNYALSYVGQRTLPKAKR